MHYIKISSFRFYHTKSHLYLCLYIYGYKSLLFVGFFYKYQAPSLGQVLCEAQRIHLLTITRSYQVSVSGNFEPTGARWLRTKELVRLEVRVMTEKSRKASLVLRVREGFPAKGRAELGEAWRGRSHPWRTGERHWGLQAGRAHTALTLALVHLLPARVHEHRSSLRLYLVSSPFTEFSWSSVVLQLIFLGVWVYGSSTKNYHVSALLQ